MQKTIGDEILARDLNLFSPAPGVELHVAYPSRAAPRFVAPLHDVHALRFLITLVSADKGVRGALLRGVARLPGVPRVLARAASEPFLPERGTGQSFVSKVKAFVREHRDAMPREAGELRITKFCQRIAGPDTKILFLLTDEAGPVCIVKTMRSPEHNERLRAEASAQRTLESAGCAVAPRFFCEGTVDGRYLYAEEAISGISLSRREARARERELIDIIKTFPARGSMSTDAIAFILGEYAPPDQNFARALERLRRHGTAVQAGLTHSDLGRVNILRDGERIRIVDWGRAGERPFYLLDAVYLLVRLHGIRSADEWRMIGVPRLVASTRIGQAQAEALYDIYILTEILYRKHKEAYRAVVAELRKRI